MGRKGRGIPERWLDYKAIGDKIEGFPIRACKVPLKQAILHGSLEREQWFTPEMLIDGVPDVGCIVDLTATMRYYDPYEFTRRGIRHVKIFCEGHVIPSAETVERFFVAVNEFLGHSISKDKVLLVHCTHGLNRTGYLVARYMVEQRGFEPQDAIRAFNEARGHSIERANYLADLQARKAISVPIAPTPESTFGPAECEEGDARSEQTTRDRHRRFESSARSWSREGGASSYGNSSYGNSSYGNSSYGNSSYGNSSYGNNSYGNNSYGNNSYGDNSYGNNSYGTSSYRSPLESGESRRESYGGRHGRDRYDSLKESHRRSPLPTYKTWRYDDNEDNEEDDRSEQANTSRRHWSRSEMANGDRRAADEHISPEPEAPGSGGASIDVATVQDANKPPKWRIPKKVVTNSQVTRK